jgi:uncharacterized OB-fold protein
MPEQLFTGLCTTCGRTLFVDAKGAPPRTVCSYCGAPLEISSRAAVDPHAPLSSRTSLPGSDTK